MRHRNKVRQLGRTHAHRKAMFTNMVTSLFLHERIVTTKQKAKELRRISEKLITRAKKNLALSDKDAAKKLHNKREVMKVIKNRDVVKKLFEDIAPRYREKNGGYTRIYLQGRRVGDAAEMSIIELVMKKAADVKTKGTEGVKAPKEKKTDKITKAKKETKPEKEKKEVKEVKEVKVKKETKEKKEAKAKKDTKDTKTKKDEKPAKKKKEDKVSKKDTKKKK